MAVGGGEGIHLKGCRKLTLKRTECKTATFAKEWR